MIYSKTVFQKKIYDQQCDGSQSKKSSNLSIGLDTVIESIPTKFNLGSGSSSEKITNFCRTFNSELNVNSNLYSERNLVSVDAVKQWGECIRLYGEGIVFNPIVNTRQAIIQLSKRTADPVTVTGIQFDTDQLSCTVPDDDNTSSATKASMDTRKQIRDGNIWTASCNRQAILDKQVKIYPETDLTVHTTKGSFSLLIQADTAIGSQSANEITRKINVINADLSKVADRKPKLECKTTEISSPKMRNPFAIANIPVAEGPSWVVTGGGCEASFDGGHWPPIGKSGPEGVAAWVCQGRDAPDRALVFSITARAVYCRVIQ